MQPDYSDRAGRTGQRRVDPYRQVLLGQRWYLLAWDHRRRNRRTFRLDRIISGLTVQGTTFAPREPPGADPVGFVQDSAMFPISRHRGVVRFAAPIEQVSERLAAEAGSLEEIDEGSCRFVTAADSWEWPSITIAMVGVPTRSRARGADRFLAGPRAACRPGGGWVIPAQPAAGLGSADRWG